MAECTTAFTDTDERREFRAALRSFLERHASEEDVRRSMVSDDGYDPAVWRAMAEAAGGADGR